MVLFRTNIITLSNISQRNLSYGKIRTWYANLVKPKPFKPPYRHVIQIGDPTLRLECARIEPDKLQSVEIQFVLHQLKKAFKRYNCVGLSAPQIGIPLQLFAIELNKSHCKQFRNEELQLKEISLTPFTVVVNPQIKVTDYTKLMYSESCESVRGYWADVPRYRAIELKGLDEHGVDIQLEMKGWAARIVQHEMDHLKGRLYTDIMDRKSLTCGCWEVVNERCGRVRLPFGPE